MNLLLTSTIELPAAVLGITFPTHDPHRTTNRGLEARIDLPSEAILQPETEL
jgi:hypothetical protein